jgi:hypothetical protein
VSCGTAIGKTPCPSYAAAHQQLIEINKLPGKDGATYQEIADAAGVGVATAWRAAHDVQLLQMQKLPGKDGLTLFRAI